MEKLIDLLEKKQSEYVDLEEFSSEHNLTYREHKFLVNGWDNAFEYAKMIIKENADLFKD